jgi:predicted nucleotidyltransferase
VVPSLCWQNRGVVLDENLLRQVCDFARAFGASRVLLFGSAAEAPERARDLELAPDGVEGWEFFRSGARLERIAGVPVDLVPLPPVGPFTLHVEARSRVLLWSSG